MGNITDSKILQHNRYLTQLQLLIGSVIAAVLAVKELSPIVLPYSNTNEVMGWSIVIAVIVALAGFRFLTDKMTAIEDELGGRKEDERKESSSVDVLFRDSIQIIHRDSKGNVKKIIEQ